jgi:hypothetical protein
VLVFHPGCDQIGAGVFHFSEQCLAGFVDEDNLFQIDDRTR